MTEIKNVQTNVGILFINNFGADLEDKLESLDRKYHQTIGSLNGLNISLEVIKAMGTEENKEELLKVYGKLEILKDRTFQETIETKARSEELKSTIKFLKEQVENFKAILDNPNVGVRPEVKPEKAKSRRKIKETN